MSSRLFQNIREKHGLCYYINASHGTDIEYGIFTVVAGIDKERFDFGVEKIYEEIANISTGNLTTKEFQNAKSFAIGQIQMGIETTDSMANFLGSQFLHLGYIETLEERIAKINAVKLEEVLAIGEMLQQDKLYLYYVK